MIEEESKDEVSGVRYDDIEEEEKGNNNDDVVRCFTNFYKKQGTQVQSISDYNNSL